MLTDDRDGQQPITYDFDRAFEDYLIPGIKERYGA